MANVVSWQQGCDFEDSLITLPTTREVSLKLLLLGDVMVGKTSLAQRYVNSVFRPSYKETIGVDFSMKTIQWSPDLTVKLQLWDVAGMERLGAVTRAYYRNADGCLLLFDLTDRGTFERVAGWKEDLDSKCRLSDGSPVPCLLLGNKRDLADEWSVGREDMVSLTKRYGFCSWRAISVKDNLGVDEAISFLVQQMLSHAGRQLPRHMASFQVENTKVTLEDPSPARARKDTPSAANQSDCC